MTTRVLIAHAKGEADAAERLAGPIRAAGYEVAHEGTLLVGDSLVGEASRLLAEGSPVVLCGTVRAMGTKWARQSPTNRMSVIKWPRRSCRRSLRRSEKAMA